MINPYFEFQLTDREGNLIGEPDKCHTEESVIFLCDPRIKLSKIRHLCAIARQANGGPVDITHFENDGLVWSARIHYKEGKDNGRNSDLFR